MLRLFYFTQVGYLVCYLARFLVNKNPATVHDCGISYVVVLTGLEPVTPSM